MDCKLKVILADKMIKQSALAKRANITDQTLSMIVRGKVSRHFELLCVLQKHLTCV